MANQEIQNLEVSLRYYYKKNPDGTRTKVYYAPVTVEEAIFTQDGQKLSDHVNGKVDKVTGKGLSTNDYTNDDKSAVQNISQLSTNQGTLSSLNTTNKTNLVSAINEVKTTTDSKANTSDLKAKLEVKQVNADGSIDIQDGNGNAQKYLPQSALAKWGVISHTQKWTQYLASKAYSYNIISKQYGWIPTDFIKRAEIVGFAFNTDTGYFAYRDYNDISYNDMIAILNNKFISSGQPLYTFIQPYIVSRGNYSLLEQNSYNYTDLNGLCFNNSSIEFVVLNASPSVNSYVITNNKLNYAFQNCTKLVYIYGIMQVAGTTPTNTFYNCFSLKEVRIKKLSFSISFVQSSMLSLDSIIYMISNASTTEITITLHADAYARAMADADVQSALASKTNITLVSA